VVVIKEIIFANTPLNFLGLLCNNDEMINKMERKLISGDKRNKVSYHTTKFLRVVM